jgi:predicted ester cyclase
MPGSDTERNKQLCRHFTDGMNTNDAEIISRTIDDLVVPDAVIRTPLPLEVTGAQALKEIFTRLHSAYPDLHVAVEDLIAEGDKVVSRNVVAGAHRGEYLGCG